jgi:hypothetical protein
MLALVIDQVAVWRRHERGFALLGLMQSPVFPAQSTQMHLTGNSAHVHIDGTFQSTWWRE